MAIWPFTRPMWFVLLSEPVQLPDERLFVPGDVLTVEELEALVAAKKVVVVFACRSEGDAVDLTEIVNGK